MGGTVVKNGPFEMIQFPGVFIMLRQGEASGPPARNDRRPFRVHRKGYARFPREVAGCRHQDRSHGKSE